MNRHERGDLAEKMYVEDKMIIRKIAERLGVSKTAIWKDLKARNVEMRPSPDQIRQQRRAQQFLRRAEKKKAKEHRKRAWGEQQEPSLWAIEQLIDSL